jgi:hypothetical protein
MIKNKMTKTKTFLMTALAFIVAVTTFTSCNSDDDDYQQLTAEQWLSYYNMVGGIHTGTVIVPQESLSDGSLRCDTLSTVWEMKSDSTITISNFPLSTLGGFVRDTTLKAAIQTAPNQNLTCTYEFYSSSSSVYSAVWGIYPQVANDTLTYKDETGTEAKHKLSFVFYWMPNYSFGQYDRQNNKIQMQIILAGVSVDNGAYDESLSGPVGISFTSEE